MLTPEVVMLSTVITVLIVSIALVNWVIKRKKKISTPEKESKEKLGEK